jgi:hypothetical protein
MVPRPGKNLKASRCAGHPEQPPSDRSPAGIVVPGPPAELDESLLDHLFGQSLVVEHVDAEPEQLHVVLAKHAGPAVARRQGPPPPVELDELTCRSVRASAPGSSMWSCPGKTFSA